MPNFELSPKAPLSLHQTCSLENPTDFVHTDSVHNGSVQTTGTDNARTEVMSDLPKADFHQYRQSEASSHAPLYKTASLNPTVSLEDDESSLPTYKSFDRIDIQNWENYSSPIEHLKIPKPQRKLESETPLLWEQIQDPRAWDLFCDRSQHQNFDNPFTSGQLFAESNHSLIKFAGKPAAILKDLPYECEIESDLKRMGDHNIATLVILTSSELTAAPFMALSDNFFNGTQQIGEFKVVSLPYYRETQIGNYASIEPHRIIIKSPKDKPYKPFELEVLLVHQADDANKLSESTLNQAASLINKMAYRFDRNGVVWMYEDANRSIANNLLGTMALQRYSHFKASLSEIATNLYYNQDKPLLENESQLNQLVKIAKLHQTPIYPYRMPGEPF